jgi:hypothetical protein
MFVGLHIHKTAGTSLLRYLEGSVPRRLHGAYALRNYQQSELPLWASSVPLTKDIFWGHSIYESFFYHAIRPIHLFTFLRDPSERIVSWYSMLRRRKKLKKAGMNLESFAEAHSNSICKMLISRFPSLSGPTEASLSEQAFSVLEHMSFVGFQCQYTEDLRQLLEWMKVPVHDKKLSTRHNIAKKATLIDSSDQAMLNRLNQQDNLLYSHAFECFSSTPLKQGRHLSLHSLASASGLDPKNIRSEQLRAAQKKFILGLRLSIGDIGVDSYIKQICSSFESCEQLMANVFDKNNTSSEISMTAGFES